jgi:hypothetical protein
MVPASALAVAADGKCMSCNVFSLVETIRFESLDFIPDRFNGLSLSPMGNGSGAAIMGSTRSRTLPPL